MHIPIFHETFTVVCQRLTHFTFCMELQKCVSLWQTTVSLENLLKILTQKFLKMRKFFMAWENEISVHLQQSFRPYLNWILLRTDITRPDEYCNCLFMLTDALFFCLFLSLINIAAAIDLYLGNVPLNQKRQILILISTNQNFVFRFNGFSPKI